jgi:hypothetical protein
MAKARLRSSTLAAALVAALVVLAGCGQEAPATAEPDPLPIWEEVVPAGWVDGSEIALVCGRKLHYRGTATGFPLAESEDEDGIVEGTVLVRGRFIVRGEPAVFVPRKVLWRDAEQNFFGARDLYIRGSEPIRVVPMERSDKHDASVFLHHGEAYAIWVRTPQTEADEE